MAASAVAISDRISLGHTDYLYIGVFTPSTSYPTGGEPIDLTAASGIPGPSKIKRFIPQRAPGGAFPSFIDSSQKLRLDSTGTGTEVANTTDKSAELVPFIAIGA